MTANSKFLTPIILKSLVVTFPAGSVGMYVLFPATRDAENKEKKQTKQSTIN